MLTDTIRKQKLWRRAAGLAVLAGAVVLMSGCNIVGFFLNPTGFEEKVPAQYDIREHDEEMIYIVVHTTYGSGADVDLPNLISASISGKLQKQAKVPSEQILEDVTFSGLAALEQTPEERAKSAGADLLLYVEIGEYELFNVHGRDYYTGQLMTRSMLRDLETNEVLWPQEPTGRRVEAVVELETGGRETALGRLTAATAHCIVRELVPTPKGGYRCADEHQSVEDIMKDLE